MKVPVWEDKTVYLNAVFTAFGQEALGHLVVRPNHLDKMHFHIRLVRGGNIESNPFRSPNIQSTYNVKDLHFGSLPWLMVNGLNDPQLMFSCAVAPTQQLHTLHPRHQDGAYHETNRQEDEQIIPIAS